MHTAIAAEYPDRPSMEGATSFSQADMVVTQQKLAAFNARRLVPTLPTNRWRAELAEEITTRTLEGVWLEGERRRQIPHAATAPTNPGKFVEWIDKLRLTGPGQGDRLFPYLAESATLEQMRWFLAQEISGEAGFEDLVALTQIRLPTRAKIEMARNYWDEMGRGNPKGMHGPMLTMLGTALDVYPLTDANVWEPTALNNLMVGLVANRRYAYHAIGALGIIELTAPGRALLVSAGLRRLGVKPKVRNYFDLHSVLDVQHAKTWSQEIYRTIVAENPAASVAIAEGALMRLYRGKCCFRRYRAEFGL